jgi:hypothetical protein
VDSDVTLYAMTMAIGLLGFTLQCALFIFRSHNYASSGITHGFNCAPLDIGSSAYFTE